jgi:mono/diheme cytochrome c family protein
MVVASMRASAAVGWAMLLGGLALAAVISIGLYRWDVGARQAEASLRPQPVAPLAAAAAAPPTTAPAAQPAAIPPSSGDVAAGQAKFLTTCFGCHPNGNAGIGPALHGPAFVARYPDDAAITALVRGGRGGMPAFGPDKLSDTDLTNIIAYLRSLPAAPVAAPGVAVAPSPAIAAAAPGATVAPSPAIAVPLPGVTAAASPAVAGATPTPLSQETLSSITPGLSSYMLEAAKRMGPSWFAAEANNWDEAAFEVREAHSVLQAGAARSNPARAQAITAFNDGFMTPLATAAQSGDAAQYQQAYRTAIQVCNACHASQAYGQSGGTLDFIRVQVPTTSIWDVYAYTK